MDEKQLKTSLWQRIVIIVVALLLLGSTMLTYIFIVMSNSTSKANNDEKIARLQEEYTQKSEELTALTDQLSDKYFKEMEGYLKNVKSYNAATANSEKLKIDDLKQGDGRVLEEDDTDYMAYYIGWCADGSIFDSSFEYAEDDTDKENPIGLKAPLITPSSLIEGWESGVVGMKLNGVRQLTIAGELAYGESRSDICGQSNAPLKFIVKPVAVPDDIRAKNEELNQAYYALYTALVGGN